MWGLQTGARVALDRTAACVLGEAKRPRTRMQDSLDHVLRVGQRTWIDTGRYLQRVGGPVGSLSECVPAPAPAGDSDSSRYTWKPCSIAAIWMAQGYIPVMGQDGKTVYLVQSARSVRGGVGVHLLKHFLISRSQSARLSPGVCVGSELEPGHSKR